MVKADPFQQRRLLEVAALDRSLGTITHRRSTLPELAEIGAASASRAELSASRALAEAEVDDLDREARKLDTEIDAVRARAERDAQRLQSGVGGAAALAGLQHEIESLARRQGVLEDAALELMERRETADATVAAAAAKMTETDATISAAETRRDSALAELAEQERALTADRDQAVSGLSADLLGLYDKIRATGKVAAGELTGPSCGACRMDIDRTELAALRAAPMDEVVRCPECGAILIRA